MEKLKERISTLVDEVLPEALEPMRQRFLKDGPKLLMNQTERRLLALDLNISLKDLKKAS